MIIKTTYSNDTVRSGGSDVPMVRLVTRWCDHDDCDGSGDSGTIYVDVDAYIAQSKAVFRQDSM